MIALFTILLLVLLAIGVPVAFSLGAGGLVGMLLFMGDTGALQQIPILAYKSLDDFVLCAVPLYILMSAILLKGKVGEDLFELGNKWLRHLPGGLGVATIVACGIFAAITGSSVACAVTIGAIAIPEMLKRGYDRTVVLGAVAGGGTLGILIPPSIPMILYGAITGESIGRLFMSGVLPGILMCFLFILLVVWKSRRLPLEPEATMAERMQALRKSFWAVHSLENLVNEFLRNILIYDYIATDTDGLNRLVNAIVHSCLDCVRIIPWIILQNLLPVFAADSKQPDRCLSRCFHYGT